MGTVTDINEFRKKKELEEEAKVAEEIKHLLNSLMLDDQPLIVSYEDSDGMHFYTFDNSIEDFILTDSDPYKK